MRPIDADELGFELKISPNGYLYVTDDDIINAPTLDIQARHRGHWNEKSDCSVCGNAAPTDNRYDFIDIVELKYCPYCGAKMDEEDE